MLYAEVGSGSKETVNVSLQGLTIVMYCDGFRY